MKKILAIGLGFFAFVALAVIGALLVMPKDDLAAIIHPIPVLGSHADTIVDFKSGVSNSLSYFADDVIYETKLFWRNITSFSLADGPQKVVIELAPIRTSKPKPPAAAMVEPESHGEPAHSEPAHSEPGHDAPEHDISPETAPAKQAAMPMQPTEHPQEDAVSENHSEPETAMTGAHPAEQVPHSEAPQNQSAEHMAEEPMVKEPMADTSADHPSEPKSAAPPPPPAVADAPQKQKMATDQPAQKAPEKHQAAPEPKPKMVKKPEPEHKPKKKPPPPAPMTPETDTGSAEHKKGLTYYKGLAGVAKNFKTAAKWFRQAAAKGNAAAQYNLGIMAYLGQGEDQSYEQASSWFRMAAKQDHALAQYNLGFLFYEGKGVEKDDLQAFMWIDRAARLGDEKAIKARDTLEKILPKDLLKGK